jgi:hypothetical protein
MDMLAVDWGALREQSDRLRGSGRTVVHVASGGKVIGLFAIADAIRPTSRATVAALRQRGVKVVMLTGDNAGTAKRIATDLGMDIVLSDVLPGQKADKIKDLQAPGMKVGKFKHQILHVSFTGLEQLQDKFNKTSSSRAKNATLKSFWYVALRLLFARPFYFLNHYVRRGLWREGWYGFAVANIAAHGRWLKDAKMLEIYLRRRDEAKAQRR